jgi:hypothetical protein
VAFFDGRNTVASESTGAKNQPYFSATGAPEIDVDPGVVSDYAAKVGNRRVGTTAERNAATGKDVWPGLEWYDTTEDAAYVRTSSSTWARLFRRGHFPYAMAAGAGSNPASAYTTVTFPVGRFTVVPWVTAMSNGVQPAIINVGSISNTSMEIAGFSGANNIAVQSNWYWIAVQMTPTSATG